MKNTLLLIAGVSTLVLSACGNTTTNDVKIGTGANVIVGDSEFGVESCDKYVKLMDCVISKMPEDQQVISKKQFSEAMGEWKKRPMAQLKEICDTTISQLQESKSTYEAMGCSL